MSTFCPSDPLAIVLGHLVHLDGAIQYSLRGAKVSVSLQRGVNFHIFAKAKDLCHLHLLTPRMSGHGALPTAPP